MANNHKERRPLDPVYQDAEDSFSGKLAAIEQAAENTRARKVWAGVLRWYLEHDAHHREVVADAKQIGASYWLEVCERTVQYAHAHWKKFGVLTFRSRAADNGSALPPWASLNWSTILQLACVPSAGTNPATASRDRVTRSRRGQSERDGSFSVTGGEHCSPGGGECSPPPGECSPPPGEHSPPPGEHSPPPGEHSPPSALRPYTDSGASPCSSLALAWRARAGLLAGARAVVVSSVSVVVVDDNNYRQEAARGDIETLAARIGRLVWPGTTPHQSWSALYATAVAAKLLLGEPWALRAAAAAGERLRNPTLPRIGLPLNFFLGTLRNHLHSVAGVESFASKEEAKSWLAALLYPLEEATRPWLPAADPPAAEVPRTPAPTPTLAERAAAEQRLHEGRAEKLRRLRGGQP